MRPQDVVVLLKIISKKEQTWLMKDLSNELGISNSEVSESFNRNVYAGLLAPDKKKVMRANLLDFLRYGIRYVYPQHPGAIVRGIPTAHSASPLNKIIASNENYVWAHPDGEYRGAEIKPLIASLPDACLTDDEFYQLCSLVEALRVGKTREQELAFAELKSKLLEND